MLDGRYRYHHPSLHAVEKVIRNAEGPAAMKVAQEAFSREAHRFRTGKNLTAELDGELLRAVASLIAGKAESETPA